VARPREAGPHLPLTPAEDPLEAQVDPAEFARSIGSTPDEQLAAGMRSEHRERVLDRIFEQFSAHLDPERSRGTEAVVHWRVGGRPDGGEDLYELRIEDGACRVSREASADPRVTFGVDAVDFLKLVTGNASGPRLFMAGRLRIEGDLLFATQVQGLFRMPTAG
jgi:alkyl sulfatase BDS1-like metallo-beta-lactamase superfamily hydrolase